MRGTTYLPCKVLMTSSESCWIKVPSKIVSIPLFSQSQTTSGGWSTSGPGTTGCPGNRHSSEQGRLYQLCCGPRWPRYLDWILGGKFLLIGWWGTGYPEKLCMSHPWKCSVLVWMGSWQPDLPYPQQGVELDGLSNTNHSMILWFYDLIHHLMWHGLPQDNHRTVRVGRHLQKLSPIPC